MKLSALVISMIASTFSLPAFATVVVTSPANNATVGSSVPFSATANTSTCSRGVAAVGVWVDDSLLYTSIGTSLNATLKLPTGKHSVVIQAWDYCNGTTSTPLALTVADSAGVAVASPANNSTVSSPASFAATATTACAQGVAATGVYVDGNLAVKQAGASLNTPVAMGAGQHSVVVQAWDNCGGVNKANLNVAVSGTTIRNIHSNGNWNQWGELAPIYDICSECFGLNWSMVPNQKNVSLSGSATQFNIGGTTPYSDVLWSNPVLGQGNTQGRTDANHSLLPTLHNFTLDTDVYVTNLAITQDLEFDINMYANGVGMEWGTQCNYLADGAWDLWDNVNATWFSSGVPCKLNDKAWNHVTLQVQRENDNSLLYQSITVNGVTSTFNRTVPPFYVPGGWWGMTVNFQMDGNYRMAANTTYLDNTNFTYW